MSVRYSLGLESNCKNVWLLIVVTNNVVIMAKLLSTETYSHSLFLCCRCTVLFMCSKFGRRETILSVRLFKQSSRTHQVFSVILIVRERILSWINRILPLTELTDWICSVYFRKVSQSVVEICVKSNFVFNCSTIFIFPIYAFLFVDLSIV
jgi:hypothetical protein